jgi:hypothetical protein
MIEEQKVPEKPPIVGKPPMPWEDRVQTMNWENLEGETRRISGKPETKLSGAYADAMTIVFFKKFEGNDPYRLKKSKTPYLDIHKSSVRAATAGGR